jgi:hypothetical protein
MARASSWTRGGTSLRSAGKGRGLRWPGSTSPPRIALEPRSRASGIVVCSGSDFFLQVKETLPLWVLMARTHARQHQHESSDKAASVESGTRRVAPQRVLGLDPNPEDVPASDRPTVPAPRHLMEVLASSSTEQAELAVTVQPPAVPLMRSEHPTFRPQAFRPMLVPVVRDPNSVPPARPSLSVLRLGSLQRVPVLLEPGRDLRATTLDNREAFVLGLVDGRSDIEAVLDATPMPMHQVLLIITGLMDRGLIALK